MKKRTGKANANRRKVISKKGMDQALWWVLDVILVLLSLMLFAAIIGSFGPDKQVAILNTELLRSKMNEACLNGRATMDRFSLQQPKPNNMLGAFDVLPRFAINTGGDPQYVLYYEAFPPGEAIGWELYHNFPDRFVGTFDARNYHELQGKLVTVGSSITGNDADTFIRMMKGYEESIKAEGNSFSDKNVLVSNIILNPYMNVIPTESAKPAVELMKDVSDTGNLGEPSEENRNFFAFSSYVSLSKQDQTYIKYRPCGPYSLCLKTREGIYSFPLEQCRNAGIKYVQLAYDARTTNSTNFEKYQIWIVTALDAVGVVAALFSFGIGAGVEAAVKQVLTAAAKNAFKWGARVVTWVTKQTVIKAPKFCFKHPALCGGGTVGSVPASAAVFGFLGDRFLAYKVSDFYAASPCSFKTGEKGPIKLEIVNDCMNGNYLCQKIVKYPVYEYNIVNNEKSITYVSDHYECLDAIGEKNSVTPVSGPLKCLRITVQEKNSDFCWTKNPMPIGHETDSGLFDFLKDMIPFSSAVSGRAIITNDDMTEIMGEHLGVTPIPETTKYMPATKSIAMASVTKAEGVLQRFFDVWGNIAGLTWVWPG